MKYMLFNRVDGSLEVLHRDTGFRMGWAEQESSELYLVFADAHSDGLEHIGGVTTPDQIIYVIEKYYAQNPPQWQREGPGRYSKFTEYGILRVERDEFGQWHVSRGSVPLEWRGAMIYFPTKEEAQHVADANKAAGYVLPEYGWQRTPNYWQSSAPGMAEMPAVSSGCS